MMGLMDVDCACRHDEQPCFRMMREAGCEGDLVARLGPHPLYSDVIDEIVAATGTHRVDEGWRVAVGREAVVIYWDPRRSSGSVNAATRLLIVEDLLYSGLQVTGALDCNVYLDCVSPAIDGFCYLSLYPREQWVALAAQCGRWPLLGALPSGRFPAVAKSVVVDFACAMALHCEPAKGASALDELARFPAMACVGGGQSDVICGNLGVPVAGPCDDCATPPHLHVRQPCEACYCVHPAKVPSVSELHAARRTIRFNVNGRVTGNCCFVRDAFPADWGPKAACVPTRLVEEHMSPVVLHEVDADEFTDSLVAVDARHWMLQFPVGSRVAFGTFRFDCRQPLTLVGAGPAVVRCSVKERWVLGRGLTDAARDRFLHFALGCDPSDGTARLTTLAGCRVYYASGGWAAGSVTTPLPDYDAVNEGLPGALRRRVLSAGRYGFRPGYAGSIVRAGVGWIRTGDLIVSPGCGGVCLVDPVSLYVRGAETCADLWVGCDRFGAMSEGWKRKQALSRLASLTGGGRPPSDASTSMAVVIEVADDFLLDEGGPSSDGEGGYKFGDEFV